MTSDNLLRGARRILAARLVQRRETHRLVSARGCRQQWYEGADEVSRRRGRQVRRRRPSYKPALLWWQGFSAISARKTTSREEAINRVQDPRWPRAGHRHNDQWLHEESSVRLGR